MADNYFGGVKAGATSVSIDILVRSKTDNTALTGLAFNTAGNIASYHRQGAARTAVTLATQTVTGAYSSGGFVEIDATNQPGLYRLDVPDAAFAAGVDYVTITLVTTNGYVFHERIPISSNVIQTGDSFADTTNIKTRLPAALTANGNMKASLMEILTTALTETAGLLAGGFKKFFNVATPAATMDRGILVDTVTTYTGNTPQTGDNFARLGAPVAASIAADVAAASAKLPALVGGRVDVSVGAMAANVMTAAATAADFVSEIAGASAGLDPVAIRAALGMAAADLDTQLDAIITGPIPSDVKMVNGIVINGSGVLGDEFQP